MAFWLPVFNVTQFFFFCSKQPLFLLSLCYISLSFILHCFVHILYQAVEVKPCSILSMLHYIMLSNQLYCFQICTLCCPSITILCQQNIFLIVAQSIFCCCQCCILYHSVLFTLYCIQLTQTSLYNTLYFCLGYSHSQVLLLKCLHLHRLHSHCDSLFSGHRQGFKLLSSRFLFPMPFWSYLLLPSSIPRTISSCCTHSLKCAHAHTCTLLVKQHRCREGCYTRLLRVQNLSWK